jgi:hypothetical protein
MKTSRNTIRLIAFLLFCGLSASAQTAPSDAKEFKKDGLSFNYPSGWSFNDTSNTEAQDVQLGRAGVDAQIKVWVYRTPVDSPEKMAEAKKILVDSYVAATTKSFAQEGGNPQSSPATSEIGSLKSEGVKISASLGGEPGAAEVFWGFVGKRLVVLTFFRPDRALKQATPAWDTIRSTIKIEEPQAQTKPQPKPSPTPTP